jgi:hypothetical protein
MHVTSLIAEQSRGICLIIYRTSVTPKGCTARISAQLANQGFAIADCRLFKLQPKIFVVDLFFSSKAAVGPQQGL